MQEAWLTFLSATDIDVIAALVEAFPMFLPIYQAIADYARKPEELMNMLSEALYIMDRNMERLMVEELQEAVAAAQAAAKKETTILRLRLAGKSPEEIAEELSISLEEVNKVLAP